MNEKSKSVKWRPALRKQSFALHRYSYSWKLLTNNGRKACNAHGCGRNGNSLLVVWSFMAGAPRSLKLRGLRENCYKPLVVEEHDEEYSAYPSRKGRYSRVTDGLSKCMLLRAGQSRRNGRQILCPRSAR